MPICKKCNQKFPNSLKIDDKIRNLQRRKYCLNCSPFGKHNTKQLYEYKYTKTKSKIERDIICSICSREYKYGITSQM